jgi:hypothetical protein
MDHATPINAYAKPADESWAEPPQPPPPQPPTPPPAPPPPPQPPVPPPEPPPSPPPFPPSPPSLRADRQQPWAKEGLRRPAWSDLL